MRAAGGMRRNSRALLPVALALLYAGCAGTSTPQGLTEVPRSVSDEGLIDTGNGVRLFYRVVGQGRDTVVVLHGGPGFSMSYLAADLEPLSARHTLIFYDQRGSGQSTVVTDSTSLDAQRFADDLETVRRHFRLEHVTLLAHSWGAAVAALYASRFPQRVGRLVIVDGIPVSRMLHRQGMQQLAARRDSVTQRKLQELRVAYAANPGDAVTCRSYYHLFFSAHYADTAAARRSRGDFCAGTPEAISNKLANIDRFTVPSLGDWDWRPALHAVTAPTLVIHGTADFIPLESSREWAQALPNSRLLLIDGSGHFPYVEAPEQFFAAVDAFLQGNIPQKSAQSAIRNPHSMSGLLIKVHYNIRRVEERLVDDAVSLGKSNEGRHLLF
jgi:proline iminopeptidase